MRCQCVRNAVTSQNDDGLSIIPFTILQPKTQELGNGKEWGVRGSLKVFSYWPTPFAILHSPWPKTINNKNINIELLAAHTS